MHDVDHTHLAAILESAEKIIRYTSHLTSAEELYVDEKSLDAVLMNFVVIGESANKLSDQISSVYSQIPWKSIKRFRNIIAHDYFGVDPEAVWQVIEKHIPPLISAIRGILEASEEE